ncbi:hypothetical protein M3Y98_01071700 [Aphelenchoides besseyi]|nr:hypothetical protein M3Y98_01071700 [Aphelenchoides besseyi]KAI6209613.1 hypothetical protein M3Y96_00239300 [Aphelenchoides besseyi]
MQILNKRKLTVKPETIAKQIRLCEALDSKLCDEASLQLKQWIGEGCGIGELVKYFVSYQSVRALELLCHVNEPHDKILLDHMSECLQRNPEGTIVLLGRIVQRAPSWLSKLPAHEIFTRILDLIKLSKNLEIVNSALLLIASLLPHCPTCSDATVRDLLRSFIDSCKVYHQKRKSSLEKWKQLQYNHDQHIDNPFIMSNIIVLMQIDALQYSLGMFFNVIYGIYPCNVITHLQKFAQSSGYTDFFIGVLEPLILSVRFHPNALLENREREISAERWTEHGPDEFFALCQKVSTFNDSNHGATCFPSSYFDRQINEKVGDVSIKTKANKECIHSIDENTFSMFTRGLRAFGPSRLTNFCNLNTPRNELNEEFGIPEVSMIDTINLENLLNDSLTMNTNSSNSLHQTYFLNANSGQNAARIFGRQSNLKTARESKSCCTSKAERAFRMNPVLAESNRPTQKPSLRRSVSLPAFDQNALDLTATSTLRIPPSVSNLLLDYGRSRFAKQSNEELKKQTEVLRQNYMIETENYHDILKLLGLADRLPGRIYDDLHDTLHRLNVESQRDLLESRLRLVNHHLMFERSCRLLHAQRNHHLFDRLRKQAVLTTENERLQSENRQLRADLVKHNELILQIKNENIKLRTTLHEREQYFMTQLESAEATIVSCRQEAETLRHNSAALEHNFNSQRRQLESLWANNEKEKVTRQLSDMQTSELQRLREDLAATQTENQRLRDRCQTLLVEQDALLTSGTMRDHDLITPTEDRLQVLRLQLKRTTDELAKKRDQCQYAENNCSAEIQRRIELELALTRTAKVHASQIEALDHKYDALLSVCDKQEAHIAYLYGLMQSSNAKSTSRTKNPSFTGVFHMEEMSSETINKHISDLFGDASNENPLIERQNGGIAFKHANEMYAPSSLDADTKREIRQRRPSLTTEHETLSTIINGSHRGEENKSESDESKSSVGPSFAPSNARDLWNNHF